MGLWSTVKGWFNIGGVSVKLIEVENPFPKFDPVLGGTVRLTTKAEKEILSLEVRFVMEKTSGRGEDKETETVELGKYSTKNVIASSYPFVLKPGETRDDAFVITDISMEKSLKDYGGVLGAIGKVGSFLSSEKVEFYVIAEADVKGTPFDPTDRVKINVVDSK
jgi:hypothetical protein